MPKPGTGTQLGLEMPVASARWRADRSAIEDRPIGTPGGALEIAALGLVYVISFASLLGFATFGLHPELLSRSQVSPETYARILVIAPRGQILIALLALTGLLVRRARFRWLGAFVVIYLVSLGAELAGTTVGVPFGPYSYTDVLGLKWFGHVPALIPASWFMMAVPSFALAGRRRSAPSDAGDGTLGDLLRRAALGSFILLSWDLALDPAMSLVTKHWVWDTTGPYYGMPLLNLVGWFATGALLMVVLALVRADRWIARLPTRWVAGFYGANLLLPVGMSVAAGLWGVVIATGVALALVTAITLGTRRAVRP